MGREEIGCLLARGIRASVGFARPQPLYWVEGLSRAEKTSTRSCHTCVPKHPLEAVLQFCFQEWDLADPENEEGARLRYLESTSQREYPLSAPKLSHYLVATDAREHPYRTRPRRDRTPRRPDFQLLPSQFVGPACPSHKGTLPLVPTLRHPCSGDEPLAR